MKEGETLGGKGERRGKRVRKGRHRKEEEAQAFKRREKIKEKRENRERESRKSARETERKRAREGRYRSGVAGEEGGKNLLCCVCVRVDSHNSPV